MDLPTVEVDLGPEKLEDEKEGGPMVHCDLCDTEVVHKLAQMFLPGLASACVDNTSGDLFKTPGSVAVALRKEMIDYLTQRSESFVAESIILEGGPDGEVSDHAFDIISNFVDDFASSKRNLFSRVSGWLLSEKREDKIDDFIQEMEMNGFWSLDRREAIAAALLKNVDFENSFHCSRNFNSAEELASHVHNCSFRPMICENEGCNVRFCAAHLKNHDSICPFKIIPCEQKCSDSIMRREMDRHCITVCPMKLVNCPFYAVGCRSAIAQCMIEKHRSDDLHSHLWHLLKGKYKEASGEDLKRRVEEIIQASSGSRLAEARDVRSLNSIVKDLEAKLGPLELSAKDKNSAETIAKNEDTEDSDTKTKSIEQSTQTSNMVNSSDKAKVNAIIKEDRAENIAKNEDSECGRIENKGTEERTHASNMANLSDAAEIRVVNQDNAEIYSKNEDAATSNLNLKSSTESTQTKMENLPDKGEISATSEDNTENIIKNKYGEDNNLKDKGCEERTQTSNMACLDEAESRAVNQKSEQICSKNEDAAASNLYFKSSDESTQTNTENSSDKQEISATSEDNKEIIIQNKDIEDNNLKDKDNEQIIRNSKMETEGRAENDVKSKDIEDDNLN